MKDKKFLIIDDIPAVAAGIKERIINCFDALDENINCFYFIDDALDFLESNIPDIIIIDLAMDCVGLTEIEREKSVHSQLIGWFVLRNYILSGEFKEKLQNTHCYIFSGYTKIFPDILGVNSNYNGVNIDAVNQRLAEFRDNIYFVPKVGTSWCTNELIKAIKDHSNL